LGLIAIVIGVIRVYSWNNFKKTRSYVDEKIKNINKQSELVKNEMHDSKMQLLSMSIRVLQKDIDNYGIFISAADRNWVNDINGWGNTLIFYIIFTADRILSAAEFGDTSISRLQNIFA
jgi:hypothetical protein